MQITIVYFFCISRFVNAFRKGSRGKLHFGFAFVLHSCRPKRWRSYIGGPGRGLDEDSRKASRELLKRSVFPHTPPGAPHQSSQRFIRLYQVAPSLFRPCRPMPGPLSIHFGCICAHVLWFIPFGLSHKRRFALHV